MLVKLETERLLLYSSLLEFAPVVLDYFQRNRDFLEPWVPRQPTEYFDLSFQRNKLEMERREQEAGRMIRFFIFSKKDLERGYLLGQIACSNIVRGPLQSCFLGYSVDQEVNGKGVATEALRAVLRFAADDLGLHRLEANIMPGNLASLRLVEKLGFQREGLSRDYLKINGRWEDHVRTALVLE